MPDFIQSSDPFVTIIYVMLFASGFLIVHAVSSLLNNAKTRSALNRRLRMKEEAASAEQLITSLRRRRGLTGEGDYSLPSLWFNRLVTRSGLDYEPVKWGLYAAGLAILVGTAVSLMTHLLAFGIAAGVTALVCGPIVALSSIGKSRAKNLSMQLPDALAVVIRSLEAGHPVPTAISLVGQEMPDPIGTEFGMVSDEIAYGASLSEAVLRFASRTGDADVDLFAATVRLQAKTGGNLAELLKVNAETIRERQILRLKVKAASSEGRISALILTAAPFIVALTIHFMRPEFYGSVIDRPMVRYTLGGFVAWMMIGNMIMRKMIAFRI